MLLNSSEDELIVKVFRAGARRSFGTDEPPDVLGTRTRVHEGKIWTNGHQVEVSAAAALTKLYQLLEQYAPSWYTKEHREMAEKALGHSQHSHTAKSSHDDDEFGELRVDIRRMEVILNGEPVCLAAREFRLLRYLIDRPGTAISRTELLQAVWGYSAHSSTRTVDVHIANLRRKLERDHTSPEMIVTIKGVGYRFDWEADCTRNEAGAHRLPSKRNRMAG